MTIRTIRKCSTLVAAVCWTAAAALTTWQFLPETKQPESGLPLAMLHVLLLAIATSATLVRILGAVIAPVTVAFRLGYNAGVLDTTPRIPAQRRRRNDRVVSLTDRRASR